MGWIVGFLDIFRKDTSTRKSSGIEAFLHQNTDALIKEARTPVYDSASAISSGQYFIYPPYDQFYLEYLADNYSHLRTVITRIASQTLAKGWVVEQVKDNADEGQKAALENLLNNPSNSTADIHGSELVKAIVRQIEIFDDAWITIVFDYVKDASGELVGKRVKELWVEDTKKMRFNTDRFGRFQDEIKFCPLCRKTQSGHHCPEAECDDVKLQYIAYTFEDEEDDIYFARDEVIHLNKYSTTARLYGQSPIIGLATKIETLLAVESYQKKLFKLERPPKGFLDVPGHNEEALARLGEYVAEQTAKNPNFIPIISSGEGKSGATFVSVMPTTEELGMQAYVEMVKADINSAYGVMPLVVGDVAGVGGLNAEGEQITMMDRTIAETQQVIVDGFFKPLLKLMNVTDWEVNFNPIDERNEQQYLANLTQKLEIIRGFQELGVVIDMDEEGELVLPEEGIGDKLRQAPTAAESPEGEASSEQPSIYSP